VNLHLEEREKDLGGGEAEKGEGQKGCESSIEDGWTNVGDSLQ
jgi:hypothetical protein